MQDKSNAVLICHALSMDQYAAYQPRDGKSGWWSVAIGPGKLLDTDRFFIICSNILGGCMGTTGPKEINPETDKVWGLDFPVITIRDMVNAQARLLDHLGVETLFAAIGGSMGGMQVLEWAATFPDRLRTVIQLPRHPTIRRRTSPFTRWAARPLWLIPIGMVAIISSMPRIRSGGSPYSPYGGAYHLFISLRYRLNLAAGSRTATL